MPDRALIADARTRLSSRSSVSFVTSWRSVDMLTGPQRLFLADRTYSYAVLRQFNSRLHAVWNWLSHNLFHLVLSPIYRLYEHNLDRRVCALAQCRVILDSFLTVIGVTVAIIVLSIRMKFTWSAPTSSMSYLNGVSRLRLAITLWVLSTENLKRPREELSGILSAIEKKLAVLANDSQIHNGRVRVRAVG